METKLTNGDLCVVVSTNGDMEVMMPKCVDKMHDFQCMIAGVSMALQSKDPRVISIAKEMMHIMLEE